MASAGAGSRLQDWTADSPAARCPSRSGELLEEGSVLRPARLHVEPPRVLAGDRERHAQLLRRQARLHAVGSLHQARPAALEVLVRPQVWQTPEFTEVSQTGALSLYGMPKDL